VVVAVHWSKFDPGEPFGGIEDGDDPRNGDVILSSGSFNFRRGVEGKEETWIVVAPIFSP
jgi:hypothetical protein